MRFSLLDTRYCSVCVSIKTKLFKIVSSLLILAIIAFADAFLDQSVQVKGRFVCRGKSEQFAELQLVDHWYLWSNTVLVRDVFTDPGGFFDITAHMLKNGYSMRPYLHVWHHCWEKPFEPKDPCTRYVKIPIPTTFVSDSVFPKEAWDMGEVELKDWKSGEYLYGDC